MRTDNTSPRNRGMLHNRKGFTLIEVMAVLVLLSVVAAVAYSRFSAPISSAQTDGKAAEIVHTFTDIQKAIQAYQLSNNGSVPEDTAALVTSGFLSGAPSNAYAVVYTGVGTVTYTNNTLVNEAFCNSFVALFPASGMACVSSGDGAGTITKTRLVM